MSLYRISYNTNVYQVSDHQTSVGQLRNSFRCLLQSIKDGNLADAQQAYNIITQTLPGFFRVLSGQLTNDYKAIGHALEKGEISRAQQTIVKLQQDLQSIGSTDNRHCHDKNFAGVRNPASTANNHFSFYNKKIDMLTIGTNIDIKI